MTMKNELFWQPVAGDLVRFHPRVADLQFKIQVAKPTLERIVKTSIGPGGIFIVLGQLDFEQKLEAAYADGCQADCDPTGPDTYQSYFWCLSSDSIVIIPRTFLAPV